MPLGVFLWTTGFVVKVFGVALVLLWMLVVPSAVSAGDYLDELTARSRELRLDERREWHRLLHYRPNWVSSGVHSLADSPGFFLSGSGKVDPQAELEATLASFFSTVVETNDQQNPQCQFIARYTWLKQVLAFDPARLPQQPCARFEAWRTALNPQGVTLVFPTAYLNNPSSMYGHTLLRIDAKDQDERTRLLAYAVNYSASTGNDNGVLFAINGLIGNYPGGFSIMPYYVKVREYSDLENRDIWEYELNLQPEEVDRLLMHIWELGSAWFDYYFFDENCAYYLLEALEVARPDIDLTSRFRWWAIPVDTIRAVVEQPGLLKQAVYRPSNATLIRHRLGLMSASELALVKALVRDEIPVDAASITALPPEGRARVLEVGYDYLGYLRATRGDAQGRGAEHQRKLMMARSQLDAVSNDPPVPVPSVRPDQGHPTARIAMGVGRRDRTGFAELRLRPSYHELLDPTGGYVRGAQIEFFEMALRRDERTRDLRVEEFTPLSIVSITPDSDLFRTRSWKVDVGWVRRRVGNGIEPLVFEVDGGIGIARDVMGAPWGVTTFYGFLDATARVNRRIEHNAAMAVGPDVGFVAELAPRWRVELNARGQRLFVGETDLEWSVGLRQSYTVDTNNALRVEVLREHWEQRSWSTALLSLHHFF